MLEEAFPGYQAPISAIEMAEYIYNFTLTGNKYFNGKVRNLHQELEYQIDMFNNDSCDVYSFCGS